MSEHRSPKIARNALAAEQARLGRFFQLFTARPALSVGVSTLIPSAVIYGRHYSGEVDEKTDDKYATLRRLGELGRAVDRDRKPDPYPRASGPAPSVQELRERRHEIERVASLHGAHGVRVFGSVARGEAGPGSDLDLLVDMEQRQGLFEQASLRSDLEELLHCPVHLATKGGLRYAHEHTRQRIEQEATPL